MTDTERIDWLSKQLSVDVYNSYGCIFIMDQTDSSDNRTLRDLIDGAIADDPTMKPK